MDGPMLRKIRCLFGLHRRDASRAYYSPQMTALAPCKYCGVRMERELDGAWRVSAEPGVDGGSVAN